MKIPARNANQRDSNDYDETKGWYDPILDRFVEPKSVDWVPMDMFVPEDYYVGAHAAFSGYQIGSVVGTMSGACFWILTRNMPYFHPPDRSTTTTRKKKNIVTTPSSATTAPPPTSTSFSTTMTTAVPKKKKAFQSSSSSSILKPPVVSHIRSFRKPWHYLLQRMGTGSLIGGGMGILFGCLCRYQTPYTCPFRQLVYHEHVLRMPRIPNSSSSDDDDDDDDDHHHDDDMTTWFHTQLLKRNFSTRMMESGTWMGVMAATFAVVAEESPIWMGFHRGTYGVAQVLSLGASCGATVGLMLSWKVDRMMKQWKERVLQQQSVATTTATTATESFPSYGDDSDDKS